MRQPSLRGERTLAVQLRPGEPVRLGLILEAVDLSGDGAGECTFVIDASLIPQPEYLDREIVEEAKAEGAKDRGEQIRYTYEGYGGVPVNIDAVQPAKASCGNNRTNVHGYWALVLVF